MVALAVIVVLGYMGTTLLLYLHNPAYGVTLSARAAEWGRDNGLGTVVGWAEQEAYRLNPPKIGGKPPKGSFGGATTPVAKTTVYHLAPPTRLRSPAGTPLPGEGVWHAVGRRAADGTPAMYVAFVRPDAEHTSFVAGVAWMDPTLLRAQLYSGNYIPGGGPYKYSAPISAGASTTLVAAFNAGFRMDTSEGGYYTDGKVIVPLRAGAASAVIYRNGTLTVGAWDHGVSMKSSVVAVRQNLDLLVAGGRAVPGLNENDAYVWGATLGGGAYVWRSGLGVTKDGAVVYIAGPALSITSLAHLFVIAGCVRAMELDINPDWVQFSIFKGPVGRVIGGYNASTLLSDMIGPPTRYFTTWWNRDFFTMSLRPPAVSHRVPIKP